MCKKCEMCRWSRMIETEYDGFVYACTSDDVYDYIVAIGIPVDMPVRIEGTSRKTCKFYERNTD
jgi:hypothetical protein